MKKVNAHQYLCGKTRQERLPVYTEFEKHVDWQEKARLKRNYRQGNNMAYAITENGSIDMNAPLVIPKTEKVKVSRKESMAMNCRKSDTLNALHALIDKKHPADPFEFKVNGCDYRVNPGNFCAVEFYNRIAALPRERF